MPDPDAMWPEVARALEDARQLQRRVARLTHESYAHPRHGLWCPLNEAATCARGLAGQLEVAVCLLETWGRRLGSLSEVSGGDTGSPTEVPMKLEAAL